MARILCLFTAHVYGVAHAHAHTLRIVSACCIYMLSLLFAVTILPVVATAGSSVMMGAAQVDNRILGCIFTDWRGKVLKRRQSRSMMVGQIKIGNPPFLAAERAPSDILPCLCLVFAFPGS